MDVFASPDPLPADFPDSRPAVEDLKYCLERTDQRQQLLVSLKAALETRLLHPGALGSAHPLLSPGSQTPEPQGPTCQPAGPRQEAG